MSEIASSRRTKRPRASASSTPRRPPSGAVAEPAVSAERRRAMIAESAYFRAAERGFQGGDPVADWLASERDVDALLRGDSPPARPIKRSKKSR
jgi:hypothetical protein